MTTDPHYEIRHTNETLVGPFKIQVFQRPDGKWTYIVDCGSDSITFGRSFEFDWEAQDASFRAVSIYEDIKHKRTTEARIRDAAGKLKRALKNLYLFFADHYEDAE